MGKSLENSMCLLGPVLLIDANSGSTDDFTLYGSFLIKGFEKPFVFKSDLFHLEQVHSIRAIPCSVNSN